MGGEGQRPSRAATPGALGYRWPAEWEPHGATWLSWPHNRETWPGRLAAAEDAFLAIVRALAGREPVRINVRDPRMEARVRGRLMDGALEAQVEFFHVPTDDAWVRDHGPIFLTREGGGGAEAELAIADFRFDAWGGKYPPWDLDDAVPARLASALGVPRFSADFVLEGGSIDGDGSGTVLTTESCLLHSNREPGRSREAMERRLAGYLGASRVLWLSGGIAGDDTDGHVDDVARFVAPGTVVAAVEGDPGDRNYTPLQENLRRLRSLTDAGNKRLEVVTLPMPSPVREGRMRLPASYANFYLANGVVLVPTFGDPNDATALGILGELFPKRDAIPIPARDLVLGLGGVHCVTQQQPAAATPALGFRGRRG